MILGLLGISSLSLGVSRRRYILFFFILVRLNIVLFVLQPDPAAAARRLPHH